MVFPELFLGADIIRLEFNIGKSSCKNESDGAIGSLLFFNSHFKKEDAFCKRDKALQGAGGISRNQVDVPGFMMIRRFTMR